MNAIDPHKLSDAALLDNSGFAGVARILAVNQGASATFWNKFPNHKRVDIQSFAEFLTAMCLCKELWLDGGCRIMDPESWLDAQLATLPSPIAKLVKVKQLATDGSSGCLTNESSFLWKSGQSVRYSPEACHRAYQLLHSPLKKKLKLLPGETISAVYTSPDYIFRPVFEEIRKKANKRFKLNSKDLAQAMFLHRGLFLGAVAKEHGLTYFPYSYRGRMLSCLSPLALDSLDGYDTDCADLTLATRPRLQDSEILKELNKTYYDLLAEVTWPTHSDSVPFIGGAILDCAGSDPHKALDMALEIWQEGVLHRKWNELRQAVRMNDRGTYKARMHEITAALEHMAIFKGAHTQKELLTTCCSVLTWWIPQVANKVLEHFVAKAVPTKIREWVTRMAYYPVTANPFQLLFVRHVDALRALSAN